VNAKQLKANLAEQARNVEVLKAFWAFILPGETCPSDGQLALWLRLHDSNLERITYGFGRLARKRAETPRMSGDRDYQIRYVSAVMNERKYRHEQREEGSVMHTFSNIANAKGAAR